MHGGTTCEYTVILRIKGIMGSGLSNDARCVPFVSEYSDCTEANICTGCTRCTCTSEGQWSCNSVSECAKDYSSVSEESLDNALSLLVAELDQKRTKQPLYYNKQRNIKSERKPIEETDDVEQRVLSMLKRQKRSVTDDVDNGTVVFHHTVDEINEARITLPLKTTISVINDSDVIFTCKRCSLSNPEVHQSVNIRYLTFREFKHQRCFIGTDTLKNNNVSGTIEAKKFKAAPIPITSRRYSLTDRSNKSELSNLHIEHNQSQIDKYNHHITDNQIDTTAHGDDIRKHEKINKVIGNHTEIVKNKELSKVIVSELKGGTEFIGDKKSPIMSNVTFTPENNTVTAMAFIAGNLLNKLWNMEKDANDESIEIEMIKHEKISDLLDLFKEPLTLRQETFLKSALEKLTDVINNNKDVSNVSLCNSALEINEKIRKQISPNENESAILTPKINIKRNESDDPRGSKKQNMANSKAIRKLNDVLNLIRNFDDVKKDLLVAKNKAKYNSSEKFKTPNSEESETVSMNIFGKILEKITKLLVPNGNSKKLINKLKGQNILQKTDNFSSHNKIKELLKVDLGDVELTAKDKLVLDYLTQIEKKPDCFLKSSLSEKTKSIVNIEGDILLNLSEYFKIKSFVDLMKIVGPETDNIPSSTTTTEKSTDTTTQQTTALRDSFKYDSKTLSEVKGKLKAHLKSIIEDLVDLQNAKGLSTKDSDIKITDILPCITHALNDNAEVQNVSKEVRFQTKYKNKIRKNYVDQIQKNPVERIKHVFEMIKKDSKFPLTRRSELGVEERPTSAIVWERTIKGLNNLQRQNRRNFNGKPLKSFDILEKIIEQVKLLTSNTYKDSALLTKVPPSEQLTLLKTLEVDIKTYIDVLENVNQSLDVINEQPSDRKKYIDKFIQYVDENTKLSERVVKSLDEKEYQTTVVTKELNTEILNLKNKTHESIKTLSIPSEYDAVKVTRDQILNQLMKNRVELFLRIKKARGINLRNDLGYNVAIKILDNLESGNYVLARELYKIFVFQNEQKEEFDATSLPKAPARPEVAERKLPDLLAYKQPLIQFEESRRVNNNQFTGADQDQLIKQLLNFNNRK